MKFNPRPCPTIMVKSKVTGGPMLINVSQYEEEDGWKKWTPKMQQEWDDAKAKLKADAEKKAAALVAGSEEEEEEEETSSLKRRVKRRVKPDNE